jgi:hypothetical protein
MAPLYICSPIIRLQAVVEIITNETARVLNLLTKHSTKMLDAIHQNRLALDYLLASEEGVYGKFNLSNCCLQIDDEGKVIKEIRQNEKACPCPCPDLERWDPNDLFGEWFPALGSFKTLIGATRPCSGSMLNVTLPGSPCIVVYQDHYGGHYRKENGHTCNDAMEIETPVSR